MNELSRKVVAEAVGTFFIVFAGCGAMAVANRFPGSVAPGAVPVIFGLAVAAMIYAVGHISGAHFNPAVTLAFAAARHFPPREVPWYWTAQFFGAFTAIGLLAVVLPPGTDFGAPVPAVLGYQSVIWEAVLTFCLMFVIIAVATDTRAVGTMAGAAIGAAVTVGAFVGGPVTGAAMNPARALPPLLIEGHASSFWIYAVGPLLGALAAAYLYESIRCEVPEGRGGEKAKGCC